MGNKLIALGILTTLSLLALSCTKKTDGLIGATGPAGIAGLPINEVRSAITGYVNLTSQFNTPISTSDSVTVSTWMADSLIKTTTDQSGQFKLANLKSGDYRILFEGKQYDSIAINIKHSAGNEDQFINITRVTESLSAHFTEQSIDLEPSPFDANYNIATITTAFDGPSVSNLTTRFIEIYFSGSPDVSNKNYLYMGEGNSSGLGINYMITYIGFQGSEIKDGRFSTGDTVYMRTYFTPMPALRTSWFDTNTYQTISYPYYGDSLKNYFIWKN